MAIIQFAFSLIVLGIIYLRMIRREAPDTIAKSQAVVPVVLGLISTILSFGIFLFIGVSLQKVGFSSKNLPDFIRSVITAFIMAGLPEELAKLLMMFIGLVIFRSKIRNVYEYILVGAAVGFGFTLLEEFFYGTDSEAFAIARLLTIAGHLAFGIIMAKHLGMAKYNKANGSGAVGKEYVKALIIPLLIHTLFDAGTANNLCLNSSDNGIVAIGLIIGIVWTVFLFVGQIVVLTKLKKNAGKYCDMRLTISTSR